MFEKIALECAAHPVALWLHFLGEPLLHEGLVDMVRYAKAHGVSQVGVSTNATSLEGSLADALLTSGLDRLECSMDADDRETYRDMRGRDHFDRVRGNVRAFLERKRELGLAAPVTSIQFMRTPAVESSLEQLVDGWRPYLGADDFVMTIAPASFSDAIEVAIDGDESVGRAPCRWLFSALMVLQDGTVTMCGADWDASSPLGNVHEQTLAQIWDGEEMRRRRDAHLTSRFDEVHPCGGCRDWALADGHGYVNVLEEVDRARTSRPS